MAGMLAVSVGGAVRIDNNLEGITEDIPLAPMFCEGIR